MRRFISPSLALLVAACASAPKPVAPTVSTTTATTTPRAPTSALIGLTANDLFTSFGQPSFQVREGQGLKLQWSGRDCVLDMYLYPPVGGRGAETVTHVDTRRPSGAPASQSECVSLLLR